MGLLLLISIILALVYGNMVLAIILILIFMVLFCID